MKRVVLSVLLWLVVGLTGSAWAQDIAGDWQGTLHAGPADLRLVLHIAKNSDGSLHATMDSVDQGANGIPVSTVTLKDSQLKLGVDAVHGTFEGKVNADASAIEGTWSQGPPLPLTFRRAAAPIRVEHKPATPSDIDGDWWGTLDTGPLKLRLVLHIENTEDGLIATLDSPDQGMKGLPASAVRRSGASFQAEFKGIGGAFDAKITSDLRALEGTWTQGREMPLVLKRAKSAAELERRRPQNPVKPYPYREEEVTFENKPAAVTLAATLTVPQGNGPFPAVFLITGSGPQDRDESLLGHRPFFVLADYLTRKGIAVLRADDRGFGKSTGSFATATTADFATDTEAAVAYLKTRREVDSKKIGLIGHSEGGMIAPMVAARNADVAFIVLMAGPGVPGDQILAEQHRLIAEANGETRAQAEKDAAKESELLAYTKREKDDAILDKTLREKLAGTVPEAQIGVAVHQLTSPWMKFFLTYDPAVALRKVKCPVLAISGEKDLQVPPQQNLPPIRKALAESGNRNYEVDELPGLNHLFQTATTGSPSEYAEIEETMSPVAMDKMATWILKQTAQAR
jgi:pimeloyl-ACP methyl ester carboxylesterase